MKIVQDPRISRRHALQAGLLAGIGAALPAHPLAADAAQPLITKTIPSSGEKIPVIGIGTDSFGDIDGAAVRDLLQRMSEMGGAVIDTAALYAGSEERIGPALSELKLRPRMFLVSKMNSAGAVNDPPKPPVSRHGVDPIAGIDSFNRSLKRLQTDRIDLMMAHWVSSVETLMPVLVDLKRQGKVRYIGITTVSPQMLARVADYMRRLPLDFVQVQYSLDDRSAEQQVLRVALERKIAVSAARPFGGGGATGLFAKVKDRALPAWAGDYNITSWGQFFLKYVVSHPAITCAVPGATKLPHLVDNQGAGRGRLPDAVGRRKMEAFWQGLAK
jgi:aryl-alcohol dehydrogenase-like predicted oxidoreductase